VMSSLSRNRSTARWPFWLLIAAWVCANSPQAATYALLTWFGEARHFSHQQRLTAEVAHVFTGEKSPAMAVVALDVSERPFAPMVPSDATLRKIELAVERMADSPPLAVRENARVAHAIRWPDRLGEAPPHEPPRVGFAS
jgi:hypothetical protein